MSPQKLTVWLEWTAIPLAACLVWGPLFIAAHSKADDCAKAPVATYQCQRLTVESSGDFWSTKITDLLTLLVLIVQAGTFIFQTVIYHKQRRIMSGQLEAATDAAKAARDSAEGLKVTERAFLFIEITHFGQMPTQRPNFYVRLAVKNYGKTPGNIHNMRVFFRALDHIPVDADEEKYLGGADNTQFQRIAAYVGTTEPWFDDFTCDLDDFNVGNVAKAEHNIKGFFFYVWGSVEYKTVFMDRPLPKTVFKFARVGPRWVPVGPDEDNQAK